MNPKLQLIADAVGPVARGHPWVYRDAVRGSAELGDTVRLVDPRGRQVGWGLFDDGPIAVRVLAREPQDLGRLVQERLQRADSFRFRVVTGETTCWRVVHGAGDALPGVVIDRYDDLAVLRLYSAAWVPHLDLLVRTIAALPWVSTVARRLGVTRVDGQQGLVTLSGPTAPEQLVVLEHGVRLLVRPYVGQKTGLFLDQRENRRRAAELAPGRQVVNLFSYNGGFSVYAALAGAARVTSVDVSRPALDDAREIFRLNGLSPDRHAFECEDVFKWQPSGKADLVICDPPSLSHDRKSDGPARKAYRDLAASVAPMVSRDGLLASASCSARLSFERWEQSLRDGLSRSARWSVLERAEAPPDHPVALQHPEGRYLKWCVLRRL